MAKKWSNKIWNIFIYIWLVTSVIYALYVWICNISFQATIFMWITTTFTCLFYIYTFYRKNRLLAILAVISMVFDIVVACIRWLPWMPRLLILLPFIIWTIWIFWYTKINGKKSAWVLWIIFIIFEVLSIILTIASIFLVKNIDTKIPIFCENNVPYVCGDGCNIENDPLVNCECEQIDEELLWDYECDWKLLKLFDSNWQLLYTFWE